MALVRRVPLGCGAPRVLVVIVLAVLLHGAEHTPQGCVRWMA
jgi:hypothetical protein